MAKWTPELEALIRTVGNAVDKQMQDFVNPKSGVLGSGLRTVFRSVTQVTPAVNKACKKAGLPQTRDWQGNMQKLIELAEQNGSNAADKIKKWLPVSKDIASQYQPTLKGVAQQIKAAKKKYGPK